MDVGKDVLLQFLENAQKELQAMICQLHTNDCAYTTHAPLVNLVCENEGWEWGTGVDPKDGVKKFMIYKRRL